MNERQRAALEAEVALAKVLLLAPFWEAERKIIQNALDIVRELSKK